MLAPGTAASKPQWVPVDAAAAERQLRATFRCMGLWFALNHGTVTTPLVVASTLLGNGVAEIGSGILYVATILSTLLLGAPLVGRVGPKGGLLVGMGLYCVYVGGFTLAVLFRDVAALAWTFWLLGSACGGVAAGVLWTAQGGYFSGIATLLAAATGEARTAITTSLGAEFAFLYLTLEVGSKLGFSGLQRLGLEPWLVGLVYTALGLLSLVMMARVERLAASGAAESPPAALLSTASVWSDPTIWLLSPTNLTFGFCAAFMNGHVNGTYAAGELGRTAVGFLAAITAATAAVSARFFGPVGGCLGKGPVMVLGAACFSCIPLCVLVLGCCRGWGWWLLVLYILQGTGRGIYESSNRAMFADFFEGRQAEGAFANCMLQSSLAFAVSFFLQASLTSGALAGIVVALSGLTPLGLAGAGALRARGLGEGEAPGEDSTSSVASSTPSSTDTGG